MNTSSTESESPQGPEITSAENLVADEATDGVLQLVSFVVGTEEFAVPILAVQEINRMMPITSVPKAPASVQGVINLRGRIIPVIDLRQRFGVLPSQITSDARIIVVQADKRRVLGFTVDRVNEVLRIDANIVEPAPTMCAAATADYVRGVARLDGRLLILLSLTRLLGTEDLSQLESPAAA